MCRYVNVQQFKSYSYTYSKLLHISTDSGSLYHNVSYINNHNVSQCITMYSQRITTSHNSIQQQQTLPVFVLIGTETVYVYFMYNVYRSSCLTATRKQGVSSRPLVHRGILYRSAPAIEHVYSIMTYVPSVSSQQQQINNKYIMSRRTDPKGTQASMVTSIMSESRSEGYTYKYNYSS